MPRFLNSLHGIVWSIHNQTIKILLPRGGIITTTSRQSIKGIHLGQHVAFIMDALDREIIEILPKEEADEIVERGSNHLLDTALREPPTIEITEEGEKDGTQWQHEDRNVFWCPELT